MGVKGKLKDFKDPLINFDCPLIMVVKGILKSFEGHLADVMTMLSVN